MNGQDFPIRASRARYIKLGTANAWFGHARQHQLLEFGHRAISLEVGQRRDRAEIAAIYQADGRTASKSAD